MSKYINRIITIFLSIFILLSTIIPVSAATVTVDTTPLKLIVISDPVSGDYVNGKYVKTVNVYFAVKGLGDKKFDTAKFNITYDSSLMSTVSNSVTAESKFDLTSEILTKGGIDYNTTNKIKVYAGSSQQQGDGLICKAAFTKVTTNNALSVGVEQTGSAPYFESADGLVKYTNVEVVKLENKISLDSDLPDAFQYQPYSTTLSATGGTAPYSYSIADNSLPSGLQMTSSGAITGTPTSYGDYIRMTVRVIDDNYITFYKNVYININEALNFYTGASLVAGNKGSPYSKYIIAEGGTKPYSYSVSEAGNPLPEGLEINATSGAITGTPTTSGAFTFKISVTDSAKKTIEKEFNLKINDLKFKTDATLPQGVNGEYYSTAINAIDGAGYYLYSLAEGSTLPSGLKLEYGKITGTPSTYGDYKFTVVVVDDNYYSVRKEFNINIIDRKRINAYLSSLTTSAGKLNPTFDKEITKYTVDLSYGTPTNNIPEINFTTGSDTATTVVTKASIVTEKTIIEVTSEDKSQTKSYEISFNILKNSNNNLTGIKFNGQEIEGFSSDKTTYDVKLPYGTTVLPTIVGVTTDSTITITNPTITDTSGSVKIIVKAQNGDVKEYTVNYRVAGNFANDIISVTLNTQSNSNIDPVNHSVLITVPDGTDLDKVSINPVVSPGANYSITNSGNGKYICTVTAEDGTPQIWNIEVRENTSVFVSGLTELSVNGSPAIIEGLTVTSSVSAITSEASISATAAQGESITISRNGEIISDTKKVALSEGNNTFDIVVSAVGKTSKTYKLIINRAVIEESVEISTDANLPDGTKGTAYSTTITAINGATPYSFKILAGILPDDLALNQDTGEITGVPTTFGAFGFTVIVWDNNGKSACKDFSLTLKDQPKELSSENDIISISFNVNNSFSLIPDQHAAFALFPLGTDLKAVTPTAIVVSEGATCSLKERTSNTFVYIVTAENGKEQEWTINYGITSSSYVTGLTGLSVNGKELSVASSDISTTVESSIDKASVSAAATGEIITVMRSGKLVATAAGSWSELLDLVYGENKFDIKVSADSKISKTYNLTITRSNDAPTNIPVDSITINTTFTSINIGDTKQLTASVLPENATNQKISWSIVSGGDVVSITSEGSITALKAGTAVVRATSADGSKWADFTINSVVKDECFIATAAFGSKYKPEVVILRHFRDKCLLTNSLGRKFVNFYYTNSPAIADVIRDNLIYKVGVRILLIPFVLLAMLFMNPWGILSLLVSAILFRKARRRLNAIIR